MMSMAWAAAATGHGAVLLAPGATLHADRIIGAADSEAPPTLLDYMPDDWLFVVDESHITVPQIGAMYAGDHSRKAKLVDGGFRLPSALDNRPLMFDEFRARELQTIYVSATPGDYELEQAAGVVVRADSGNRYDLCAI